MKILTLDPSMSNTGWSAGRLPKKKGTWVLYESGNFELKGRKINKLVEIITVLDEIVEKFKPDVVFAESSAVITRFVNARRALDTVDYIVDAVCEKHKTKILRIVPASAKKKFTGSGKATKEDVKNNVITKMLESHDSEDRNDALMLLWIAANDAEIREKLSNLVMKGK